MSLSAWEQQALDSIKNELAGSAPELAALLSTFNWLASEEEMPNREGIRADSPGAIRRLCRAGCHFSLSRVCRRLGLQRAVILLWLLTTAALIAVALALTAGDHGTCTETVAMTCIAPSPGHGPGAPPHGRAALPGDQ